MLVSRTEIEWNVHIANRRIFFWLPHWPMSGPVWRFNSSIIFWGNSRLGKKGVMSFFFFKGLHCDPRPGKPPLNDRAEFMLCKDDISVMISLERNPPKEAVGCRKYKHIHVLYQRFQLWCPFSSHSFMMLLNLQIWWWWINSKALSLSRLRTHTGFSQSGELMRFGCVFENSVNKAIVDGKS